MLHIPEMERFLFSPPQNAREWLILAAIVFRIGLKRQPLTKYILTWRPQNPWQDKNSSTMSSGIPTRAVVPWVGHINAVVAVPGFVARSIVFANVICSLKAEKSITLQLCWFTSSPHMRFQHHRRSEKHHTPTKANDHFWSGLNVQYKVSLIKLNYPKRPDHAFFFTSVWVMWAQMSSPEASSEPEGILTWPKVIFIFSKLAPTTF